VPKELTHWMIARAAAAGLDSVAARTREAVEGCPEAFLLGAVAHDGPFYLPKDRRMSSLAARLHGKGDDDAYAPVKRAIAEIPTGTRTASAAIAFAAGALCHMAADTVFHPAVFYFTGFAAHPDLATSGAYLYRHREFESAMDLHYLSEHGAGLERKLFALWRRAAARPDAKDLLVAAARFYAVDGKPIAEAEAGRVFEQAGRTQRLFFSPAAGWLARLLGLPNKGRNGDATPLFYRRGSVWDSYFTSPRSFRDPISGAAGTFDARELFARAVEQAVSLLRRLERASAGDSAAFPFPGPCLESGHPLDENQVMRYCDPALGAYQSEK
jgi:hypothetical protein